MVLGVVSDVSTDGVLSFGGRVGLSKDWFTVYGTGGYAVEPSLGSAPFVGAGVAISVGSGVSLSAESRFWQISNYSVDYDVLDRATRSSVLVGLTYRFK